jgi:hypothetical protein
MRWKKTVLEKPSAAASRKLESVVGEYAPGEHLPLGAYVTLIAVFGTTLAAVLACRKHSEAELKPVTPGDLALLSLATHRISRVLAKDRVAAPLRAPFTRRVESAGGGEVEEEARGSGLQRAVGELVTCPFCVGPWVALGLVSAWLFRPRPTRVVASLFAVSGVSNFLHRLYIKAKQ